jgi:ABC-type lipoprotein export system ATPase subunit
VASPARGAAAATPPLISLENISRDFDDGHVVALREISVAIEPGTFTSIVGPSGSGKSSLVHIMAGFDRPTSGEVRWHGKAIRDKKAWTDLRRKEIGVVFQEFLLLPTLSAFENVAIAMSGTGLDAAAVKARATELLKQVGLEGRFDHQPHALSGGERQRVAIARSLANRPELLICDEPTGNLDSANAAAVMELLLSLRSEKGVTLVLVTHDEGIAAGADRTIHIRDGRVADDTVRERRAAE